MSLTLVDDWLSNVGYEYHCFISWPHTRDTDITDCARYVKGAIVRELSALVPNPRVFLDESENGITVGEEWEQKLGRALCRSVTMVAICAPIYYHPIHRWCGLEWATMVQLGEQRLPGENLKPIIPLMVRQSTPLPNAVSRIQFIDFSRVKNIGRSYYKTQEFRIKISSVIERIEAIATALAQRQSGPECEQFQFPPESAFTDYQIGMQAFPFRRS